jgi:hypothetical protein
MSPSSPQRPPKKGSFPTKPVPLKEYNRPGLMAIPVTNAGDCAGAVLLGNWPPESMDPSGIPASHGSDVPGTVLVTVAAAVLKIEVSRIDAVMEGRKTLVFIVSVEVKRIV